MPPLVSVIMSVHNGRPYLAESVNSLLRQSVDNLEFIFINDASSDGSESDLKKIAEMDRRVVLIHNQENLGLTKSLNRGIEQAKGDFIARQDADDISHPLRFEKQLDVFRENADLALLGTGVTEIDDKGRHGKISLQPSLPAVIKRKLLFDNAFFHPSAMWNRKIFKSHGLHYDEKLKYGQDYELFSRITWLLPVANIREPLIFFRSHQGQISKKRVDNQQSTADMVAYNNFKEIGLAESFSQKDVSLMRRLGIRAQGLQKSEKGKSWRLWQNLFEFLERDLTSAEMKEWKSVKQVRLKLLRRTLASPPVFLPGLIGLLAGHPIDSCLDLSGVVWRKIKRS